MGFSVSATVAIFAVAAFSVGGTVALAFTGSWNSLTTSQQLGWVAGYDREHTTLTVESVSWTSATKTVFVIATNAGSTVLDPNETQFFVNGVWATSDVTTLSVNGVSTTVWAPGNTLYANLTSSAWNAAPTCMAVASENGVEAFWKC
ncbi:MAG: hypothetical protein ACYDDF_12585 [Thermoplasmatota archaeon]